MKKLTLGVCLVALSAMAPAYGMTRDGAATESELKELRADKLALAAEAGTLGTLARVQHLTAWESHAQVLSNMKELVNRSGARLDRLEKAPLTATQRDAVKSMREHLAPVAAGTQALIGKINSSRLTTRFPAYYGEVQLLVAAAERSARTADRAVEVALNGASSSAVGD